MQVVYDITMKSRWGNYSEFIKTFTNQNHFENWYRYMSNKGHKIIGASKVQ